MDACARGYELDSHVERPVLLGAVAATVAGPALVAATNPLHSDASVATALSIRRCARYVDEFIQRTASRRESMSCAGLGDRIQCPSDPDDASRSRCRRCRIVQIDLRVRGGGGECKAVVADRDRLRRGEAERGQR